MIWNLNNTYEFRWEDHFVGDDKWYARTYYQMKQFKSQEQANEYVANMLAGNRCLGVLELTPEYDEILESCDGDKIEDYRELKEFTL